MPARPLASGLVGELARASRRTNGARALSLSLSLAHSYNSQIKSHYFTVISSRPTRARAHTHRHTDSACRPTTRHTRTDTHTRHHTSSARARLSLLLSLLLLLLLLPLPLLLLSRPNDAKYQPQPISLLLSSLSNQIKVFITLMIRRRRTTRNHDW